MRDPEDCGPDGITIKDRMQPLIERIAKSIRECGSACDAYLKKSFLCELLCISLQVTSPDSVQPEP